FIIFNRKKPSEYILFIEKYIPPMVMVILVTYCFAAVDFTSKPFGIPHISSALFVVIIHILLKNPLISIFGGTIIYMVLISF
ncbi:MAG: branched-chain amino acid transport, partial [Spirochaetes bacterium RIFOXYB1_FULL_32_8]